MTKKTETQKTKSKAVKSPAKSSPKAQKSQSTQKTKSKSVKSPAKSSPKAQKSKPTIEKDTKISKSVVAQEKLESMPIAKRKELAESEKAKIGVVGNIKPKWFDQPDQRVSNKDLQKLKSRNTDEDSLSLLWELGVKEHIDIALLKRARFNVDYKTKLTKIGCVIGAFELVPINENSQIYNLKKSKKNNVNTVA